MLKHCNKCRGTYGEVMDGWTGRVTYFYCRCQYRRMSLMFAVCFAAVTLFCYVIGVGR